MNIGTIEHAGYTALLLFATGVSLILGGALLMSLATRVRIRIRRPRLALPAWGGLWSLGCALALSTPAAAGSRRPSSLPRRDPVAAQPWLGVSRPSPDREAPAEAPPWKAAIHPAIHPDRQGQPHGRLFPRANRCSDEKHACMRRHPAGKGLSKSPPPPGVTHGRAVKRVGSSRPDPLRRWVVQEGDSLWGIAAAALGKSDAAAVARYWPKIHRHNRELIGTDPNLLYPGQVLELPAFDR